MFRKKIFSVSLSLALSCQLILAPVSMAGRADDIVNNLKKDATYQHDVVDKLTDDTGATAEDVDNFVRDVVNRLDGKEINKENIKNAAKESIENDTKMLKAVIYSFSDSDIENAKKGIMPKSLESLGNNVYNQLKNTETPVAGGGGGGVISSEEFKVDKTGTRAEVDAKGKQNINLTGTQVKEVVDAKKALDMKFGDVKVSFSQQALNINQLTGQQETKLQVGVKQIANTESHKIMQTANNAGLFKMAGNVFELSANVQDKTNAIQSITKFNGTVTVTLPVPAGSKESAALGNLKIYYYNEETGNWDLVGGDYNTSQNVITFETTHFSKYALLEKIPNPVVLPSKKFNDLEGHWAANDIEFMASKGYVNGLGEGVFAPQAQVTRAEFAAMLVNVLGLKDAVSIEFKDVSSDDWYYASVAKAYKAGLAKGKGSGTFAPQAPINRQEMVAMICNAMRYKGVSLQGDTSSLDIFADSHSIDHWAKQSASEAFKAKIIKGKPVSNGLNFAPLNNATRAEAVVMLKNFLDSSK